MNSRKKKEIGTLLVAFLFTALLFSFLASLFIKHAENKESQDKEPGYKIETKNGLEYP